MTKIPAEQALTQDEQAFQDECKQLEKDACRWRKEFRSNKTTQRWVKNVLGYGAIVAGGVATTTAAGAVTTTTALQDWPEVTVVAALAATALAAAQTFQNAAEKEADRQFREAACEHLIRRARHLQLTQDSVTYDDRVKELGKLSEALREICAAPSLTYGVRAPTNELARTFVKDEPQQGTPGSAEGDVDAAIVLLGKRGYTVTPPSTSS